MASSFRGRGTSRFSRSQPITERTPQEDIQNNINNYSTRIQAAGYKTPAYKKGIQRLLWVLEQIDRPRNAVMNAIEDVSKGENGFLQGLKEGFTRKETVYGSDLLGKAGLKNKYAKGIAGFGLDVLTDPLTYATLGLGSLTKGLATGAGRTMSREAAEQALRAGAKTGMERATTSIGRHLPEGHALSSAVKAGDNLSGVYKQMPELFEDVLPKRLQGDVGLEELAQRSARLQDMSFGDISRNALDKLKKESPETFDNILQDVADQYAKEGGKGLSLLGKSLVSGRAMQDAGAKLSNATLGRLSEGIGKGVSKLSEAANVAPPDALLDPLTTLRKGAGKVFKVGSELQDVNDPATRSLLRQWTKEMRAQQHVENTKALEKAKEMFGKLDEGGLTTVRKVLENDKLDAGEAFTESMQAVVDELKGTWQKYGKEEGMTIEKMLEDYVPHVKNWDYTGKDKVWQGGKLKDLKVMSLNSLHRKYNGKINDINDLMKDTYGIDDFFETNLAKIFVDRAMKHNKFVAERDFLDKVLYAVGEHTRSLSEDQVAKGYVLVVPKSQRLFYSLSLGADSAMRAALHADQSEVNKINQLLDAVRREKITRITDAPVAATEAAKAPSLADLKKTLPADEWGKVLQMSKRDLRAYLAQKAKDTGKSAEEILKPTDIPEVKVRKGRTTAVLNIGKGSDLRNLSDTEAGKIASDIVDDAIVRRGKGSSVAGTISTLPVNTEGKALLTKLAKANGHAMEEFSQEEVEQLAVLIKDLDVYAVPQNVVKYVNNMNGQQMDGGLRMLGGAIDAFYKIFKPLATQTNPAYHIRNMVGSEMQNFLDHGFAIADPEIRYHSSRIIAGKKGSLKLGEKTYTYDQVRDGMARNNVTSTFFNTDFSSLEERIRKEVNQEQVKKTAARKVVDNNPATMVLKGGRFVGNKTEQANRTLGFLMNLKKGYDMEGAARQTLKYHFDYTDLSTTEKELLKRIYPFYTWLKNNVPLQLEEILNNPGRYSAMGHLQDNMANATGTDLSSAPDWLAEQVPLPIGQRTGDRERLLTISPPPADINLQGIDMLTNIGPQFRIPVELLLNQNFLTGAPIREYAGQEGEFAGMPMSKNVAYILNNVLGAPGRFANDALSAQADAETVAQRPTVNVSGLAGLAPGILKDYSKSAGELAQQREYSQQLGNFIQMLKDNGIDVQTMTELNRNTRKRLFRPI